MIKRLIASVVCLTFIFSNLQYAGAQTFSVNQLPVPGTMIAPSAPFAPLELKGLVVDPQKPLQFQFIVDTGKGPQDTASIKEESNRLVKYFLAGLTIPEGELWVNLSPYEKDRITTQSLGHTILGRDLLAQDYILKQLTASLIYPEKGLGKEFWSRVYSEAQKKFGTTNIPVNTFNKVWILPDEAQVYENGPAAYVTKSTLKVMLDEDYLAMKKHTVVKNGTDSISSQIVRQIVLPEITKEVNEGKNFAPLRQIYDAMILAKWYKQTMANGLLDALYTNKNKTAGVNLTDPAVKEQIYQRYIQAYKKGVFNYIKEDALPDGQTMPRKYFSGGITKLEPSRVATNGAVTDVKADGAMISVRVMLNKLVDRFTRGNVNPEFTWDPKIAPLAYQYAFILSKLAYRLADTNSIKFLDIVKKNREWLRNGNALQRCIAIRMFPIIENPKLFLSDLRPTLVRLVRRDPSLSVRFTALDVLSQLKIFSPDIMDGATQEMLEKMKSFTEQQNSLKDKVKREAESDPIINVRGKYLFSAVDAVLEAIDEISIDSVRPPSENDASDAAMSSNKEAKKILLSDSLSKDNVEMYGVVALLGTIGFLGFSGLAELGLSLFSNSNDQEFHSIVFKFYGHLAAQAFHVFAAAVQDPNSYKIAAAGIGLGAALLAWQNYSLQGLTSLLKKGSIDDQEVIRRLKNKGNKAVAALMEYYRQNPKYNDGIVDFVIKLGDKRAIEPIADVLSKGHGDFEKGNKALTKLGADKETIFQANLKALNTDFKKKAIKFLADFGDRRAIEPIAELLGKGDYFSDANEALKKLGADRETVFQANLKALNTSNEGQAIKFLGDWHDRRAIQPLAGILSKGDYVAETLEALTKLKADKEVFFQAYLRIISIDSNNHVRDDARQAAIKWLGNSGDKRAIEPLLGNLNYDRHSWGSSSSHIRISAQKALIELGIDKERLFQTYLKILSNEHSIRQEAAEWLGNSGDKRAIVPLLEKLGDNYYTVRKAVREALANLKVDKEMMFQADIKLLSDRSEEIRKEAIEGLINIGDQRAIIPLFEIVRKQETRTLRGVAADAIKKLGKNYKFSKEQVVRLNLIERQPGNAQGDLFDYENEALQFADEGYDFKVIFEPETGHDEVDNSTGYSYPYYQMDSPEVLRIERSDNLDHAMLTKNSSRLNMGLVITGLNGRVPTNSIQDKNLKSFLGLLRNNQGLDNIVVVGGAVRDVFFAREVNDIDITVKVPMTNEERNTAANIGAQASKQMYERALSSLNALAQVMSVPVERFFDKDNPPVFNGIKIHYVGPYLIHGKTKEVFIQGLVADSRSRQVYSSYTAPGLLQMAIDSQGNMYGQQGPLQDALNGDARLQGDLVNGKNLTVLSMIKWLRLRHEFGLKLLPRDYSLVRKVLAQTGAVDITHAYNLTLIRQAMQDLVDTAVNPESAVSDLNNLGLTAKIGFEPRMKASGRFLAGWRKVLGRITSQPAAAFDKAMLTERQKEAAQAILKALQYKDKVTPSEHIDDIVVLGNPNLNVFRQALRLWRDHQNSRIVTLGGVARFTQPLIDNARNAGFELKDVSSEAVIMRQVMEQMIEKEKEFEDLKGQMPDFEIESQSRNTPQNILNYKKIIASELQNRSAENPYRIVYLQTPHQQLRAKATVDKYFADELKSGRLEAFSGTAEYRLEGKSAYEIAEDLLGEAVRFIIYSGYGNKSIYAPDLSSNFWNDSRALYDSLSGDEKDRVSVFLGSLIADSKVSLEDLNDEMSFARPTPGAYAQVIFLKPIIARYLANEYFETNPWKLIHGMEILGYDQFRTVDWEHAKKLKQAGIEEWSRRMGRFNKEAFSEFNSIKGTILDPLNKNGIWQEAADGETVDLKANVNLTENEVRQIAGSDFEDIWAAIQFCYAKREWDKKIHQTDMEIMMSTWGGYDYILRSNVDDLIKQGKAFAKLVGALTPATVEVKVYPKMQKFRDYTYLLPEKYQERVEKFLHMQGADRAMLQTPGGIDLNKILIHRTGHVIQMKFDPAQLNELQQGGFQGFQPVIINIQPIASPFALLGLKQPAKEPELLAKV